MSGGSSLSVGADLELEVRLFGDALPVSGRVAWRRLGPTTIGVECAPSAQLTTLIDELGERLAARRRRGCALLVEADRARAALLAEYLWSHGYDVDEAATPLQAIERLETGDVQLVAIGAHLSTCSGLEFSTFVAECFPRVHRLLVDGEPTEVAAAATRGGVQPLRAVIRNGGGHRGFLRARGG
jgi:hypothetical protein